MAKYERKNKQALKQEPSKRKKTSGATRDASHKEGESIRWGRYAVAITLLLSTTFAASQIEWRSLVEKAERAAYRPVSNVRIEGEFVFISKEKIQQLLMQKLSGDFVDVNLQQLKQSIEANPWVDKVAIQRNWPDSLRVAIVEEKPIARWSDKGFINREGKLIKAQTGNMLGYLPLLSGDENKSAEIAQNYMLFTKLLHKSQLKVSGLYVDEKYSWVVHLDQGIRLKLGQGNIQEKLENFLFIYDGYLKKADKKIKSIDMRYEQGMAVEWDENSNQNISHSDERSSGTELAAVQK